MEYGEIRVGNGTHTGRMLGYCRSCGLYHSGAAAQVSCSRLLRAIDQRDEMIAWRALKVAVALEQESPPMRDAGSPAPTPTAPPLPAPALAY